MISFCVITQQKFYQKHDDVNVCVYRFCVDCEMNTRKQNKRR